VRRRRAPKRRILPDPKYKSLLVSKMVNILLERGKKSLAERILYGAFDMLQEKTGKDPLEVFKQAIDNAKPLLETKSRRVGGATYQVPVSVKSERGASLAMRWLRMFARDRQGKPMTEKLAEEILSAYNKTGAAVKKREDVHKMAESNQAFAHYKW
jgi:small subunit ribosomal protein S7